MAEATKRLYLVRHGVTDWNQNLRMQGHTDIPLNAEGLAQAQAVANRLATELTDIQAIWSSDLQRARVTAEAIASRHQLSVKTTPDLREFMLGDWEGLTREEIIARDELAQLDLYNQDSYLHRPPNAETLQEAKVRVDRCFKQVLSEMNEGSAVIVAHGGSLRVAMCSQIEAGLQAVPHTHLNNVSVSILSYRHDHCALLLFNDASHVKGFGI